MPQVSLYLHIHQPFRLKDFSLEELGMDGSYFSAEKNINSQVFQKVAQKSYLPMLRLLEKLVYDVKGFKVSFSITGIWIEQAKQFKPELMALLRSIINSGNAEIIAESYYHSLASLYSQNEFKNQVKKHLDLIKKEFNYEPTTFRNTELVYSNDIAMQVAKLGFKGILSEGVERILQGRKLTQLFYSKGEEQLPILLKHAQLSDDIAFRFSDRNWSHYPLNAQTYLDWVEIYGEQELINLFMDFETFGEHQWEDSGIFGFFEHFVHLFLSKPYNKFVLPYEVIKASPFQVRIKELETQSFTQDSLLNTTEKDEGNEDQETTQSRKAKQTIVNFVEELATKLPSELMFKSQSLSSKSSKKLTQSLIAPLELRYDVPEPISWADVNRDLTAWLENAFQQDCIEQLYALESEIIETMDEKLLDDWRHLQTSDHFYYMCTKWSADGDVHAYFSPYRDPFEAYRRYSLVLADLKHRLWRMRKHCSLNYLLSPSLT